MDLIVDTNVLLTFFWKNSVFNKISLNQDLRLISPEFALEEINKYSLDICKKANLSPKEFKGLKQELVFRVEFVPLEEYKGFFSKIMKDLKDLEEKDFNEFVNDIDFLALALELECPLWSNDALLKKQPLVKIVSTSELIKSLDL